MYAAKAKYDLMNRRAPYTREKIFSFDAETNGIWGEPFAIGAVVMQHGRIIDQYVASCELENPVEWVKDNVLPHCPRPTHDGLASLLQEFGVFYHKHREGSTFVTHMGYIVEAYVLRLMREYAIIGEWEAPYPLHDVASMILQDNPKPRIVFNSGTFYQSVLDNDKKHNTGLDPTSVDKFIQQARHIGNGHPSKRPDGIPDAVHNPLYDAWAAAEAFTFLREGEIDIPWNEGWEQVKPLINTQ